MHELSTVPVDSLSQFKQSRLSQIDHLSPLEGAPHSNTRMRPIAVEGCFGWLHGELEDTVGDIAVLLCSGLGRDARTAYRPYRLLADQLAAAGYPTLRFEYPGAGDSLDVEDAEQWAVWQHSINIAADWLLAHTGNRRIVLGGLGFGATLAAVVASRRKDVVGLLLLAPVVRGQLYIRQIAVEAQQRVISTKLSSGGLELNELRLSKETIRLVNQVDLRKVCLPVGCQVATFSPFAGRSLKECLRAWADRGAVISCNDFDGLGVMLIDTYRTEEKQADFSAVLTWIQRALPCGRRTASKSFPLPEPMLRPPGCIEIPLRFGIQKRLFGILCRPTEAEESDLVVVVGNTGGDPHYGFARFAVELARRLAAFGIASLRLDFAGLGDSIRVSNGGEAVSHVFNVDRETDIAAALDMLENRGYRRFAMQGLCSGAFHAFHAGLRDPRISALVLINLPVFTFRSSESIVFMSRRTAGAGSPRYYLTALARKGPWIRLARGQLELPCIIAALCARFRDHCGAAFRHAATRFGWKSLPSFASRSLMTMSRQGTRILFLFANGDPGVLNLERFFGPKAVEMVEIPGMSMRIEPTLDHELTTGEMRRTAEAIILEFLLHYNPPAPQTDSVHLPPDGFGGDANGLRGRAGASAPVEAVEQSGSLQPRRSETTSHDRNHSRHAPDRANVVGQ
jgi:pimeloyl-ACP methyl ester carboxylesterase